MLTMVIMYLQWILVYEPQSRYIADELERFMFIVEHRPSMYSYMAGLAEEIFTILLIALLFTLIVFTIDLILLELEIRELDKEIEEIDAEIARLEGEES